MISGQQRKDQAARPVANSACGRWDRMRADAGMSEEIPLLRRRLTGGFHLTDVAALNHPIAAVVARRILRTEDSLTETVNSQPTMASAKMTWLQLTGLSRPAMSNTAGSEPSAGPSDRTVGTIKVW